MEKQNQDTVALSTAEAKYVVLPVLNKSVFGKKKIKKKKKKKIPSELGNVSGEENKLCIATAKNPQHHSKLKHTDIKHHFIRDKISQSQNCPTRD